MTGTRGPLPKRSEERRRTNKPENEGKTAVTQGPGHKAVMPAPHPDWHPLVTQFYLSLNESGESAWYQASDWMAAYVLCESMSRDLKPQFAGFQERYNHDSGGIEKTPVMVKMPLKGASLAAYLRLFNTLGVTEGDRRRIGIELQKPTSGQPSAEELAAAGVADLRDRMMGGA